MRSPKDKRAVWRVCAALLLAFVLVAAGCGGGDDGESADDSDAAASGEPAESGPEEVNIGVLMPLTGPFASFGVDWEKAAQMAIDEANAVSQTEFNGVVGDDPDPQAGLQAARKMISTQGVTVIVGGDSSTMIALETVAERERTPVISSYAGTVELDPIAGDWLWRTVSSDSDQALVPARFFEREGIEETAVLIENTAPTRSFAETFKEAFTASGGSISDEVEVNPGEPSYRAAVGEILRADPTYILCSCSPQTGASILGELSSSGYDGGRFVPAEMSTDEIIEAVGADIMEGTYSYTLASDPELPGYQGFATSFEERFGHEAVPYSASAYDAAVIAILASIAARSSDGPAIRDQLREVSGPPGKKIDSLSEAIKAVEAGEDIDYEGASGPVDLLEDGSAKTSYAILLAQDGRWETVEYYSAEEFAD
jgi:ABC-type branched-subunit amino acid transport system substrate-binding protein